MLIRIRCAACGYEVTDTVESKLIMRQREDWIGFMLQRVAKGGKTARFLRSHEVPCPTCGSTTAWENCSSAPAST